MNRGRHKLCHSFQSCLDTSQIENQLKCGDENIEIQEQESLSKVAGLIRGLTDKKLGRRSPDSRAELRYS